MSESEANEGLKLAIETLLENFLVERENEPEAFRDIIANEKSVRLFMNKNFGYQLKLDSETAKLEKVPFFPREWMGVDSFKDELDYMFLMAILACLESKAANDGFLLSEIIEEVKYFLEGIYDVEWRKHTNRQSFIRAINFVTQLKLIELIDGDVLDFEKTESGEVLYHATSLIRYMFRNFSKSVREFESNEELIHDGLDRDNTRHTFMRKLYFEPVVHYRELTEKELDFINTKEIYEDIKANISYFTPFELERSYQCFYLVHRERKRGLAQHPSFKSESYIVSQVATTLSKNIKKLENPPLGLFVLTNQEFEDVLKETKNQYSLAWSNTMRELSFSTFKDMIVRYVIGWKLARYDNTTLELEVYPPFIRTLGEYEDDLRNYIDLEIHKEDDVNEGTL